MARRLLGLLVFCILALVCAAFVHLNASPVRLDLFMGVLRAPLAYTLIGAFALGWLVTVIGALAWGARVARHRRELRHALKLAQAEARTLRATAPPHAS
jgi:uncharacterized integral membrane protein